MVVVDFGLHKYGCAVRAMKELYPEISEIDISGLADVAGYERASGMEWQGIEKALEILGPAVELDGLLGALTEEFARTHPTGKFLVGVASVEYFAGHAMALIDGEWSTKTQDFSVERALEMFPHVFSAFQVGGEKDASNI